MILSRAIWAIALISLLTLGACAESTFLAQLGKRATGSSDRPAGDGTYVVGNPYQVSGIWFAPREDFQLDETGVASIQAAGLKGIATANGERFDPTALTAAHPTLQLPSIVRVTNLDNGRAVILRVNDRGPLTSGRAIDVSRRASELLAFDRSGTAKVRIQVLEAESRQVATEAQGRSPDLAGPAVASAPRGGVTAESLAPPPGARSGSGRAASSLPAPAGGYQVASLAPIVAVPARLPERVEQDRPRAGQIWVQAGAFSSAHNAERMSAKLSGLGPVALQRGWSNGRELWRVRLGPAASVAEADRLLARAAAAGANEARIVVD